MTWEPPEDESPKPWETSNLHEQWITPPDLSTEDPGVWRFDFNTWQAFRLELDPTSDSFFSPLHKWLFGAAERELRQSLPDKIVAIWRGQPVALVALSKKTCTYAICCPECAGCWRISFACSHCYVPNGTIQPELACPWPDCDWRVRVYRGKCYDAPETEG